MAHADGADELLLPGTSSSVNSLEEHRVSEKGLTTLGIDRNFANVLNGAFGFLLVFTAFQTTQMLAASIIGDLGTISIGLIYVCFAVGGFAAPAAARAIGHKKGLFFGSLAYVLFVASLVDIYVPITLICSAIIGFGAALLWCSQGILMTQSTNNMNKTKYNSMFWGIFNLCVIPGNIAGHFILLHGEKDDSDSANVTTTTAAPKANPFEPMVRGWQSTNSVLFLVLTICGFVGACLFLLIQPSDPKSGTKAEIESRSVATQMKATFTTMYQPRMICLLPLFTFTGVNMTMWASWFTRQMYKTEIGLVMSCFGVAEFIGGFTIGRFIEAYGRNPGLIFATICGVLAMALTYLGSDDFQTYCAKPVSEGGHGDPRPCKGYPNYAVFYIAAVLYGFTDCTIQSVSAAICAKSFNATGNTADAWALFRTFQAVGAAACFFISPALVPKGESYSTRGQLFTEIAINSICGVAALFGHWLFTRYPVGTVVDSADAPPFNHSSKAVIVDRMVYTSAFGGNAGSKVESGTSADEARAACEELVSTLDSVGSGADKVVKATIYTTPDANLDTVLAEYESFFTGPDRAPQPVLSMAMVARLPFQRRVQIDVVATV